MEVDECHHIVTLNTESIALIIWVNLFCRGFQIRSKTYTPEEFRSISVANPEHSLFHAPAPTSLLYLHHLWWRGCRNDVFIFRHFTASSLPAACFNCLLVLTFKWIFIKEDRTLGLQILPLKLKHESAFLVSRLVIKKESPATTFTLPGRPLTRHARSHHDRNNGFSK